MPNFKEDKGGFKMDKPMKNTAYYKGKYSEGMSEAAQGMADAKEQERAAMVKQQKASGDTPNKFWATAAKVVIGANKRRQAKKDAAEKSKHDATMQAMSRKL